MRIALVFILSLLLWSCKESPYHGYSLSDQGLNYKLISLGDGDKKIEKGDYVTLLYSFNFLDSFYQRRQLLKIDYLKSENTVLQALKLMREGDSLSVYLSGKDLNTFLLQNKRPELTDQIVLSSLKLENHQTNDEFVKSEKEFFKWLVNNKIEDANTIKEQSLIDEYIKSQEEEYAITPTGLYYSEIKEGYGDPVQYGEAVILHFEGYTLDGKKFDSTKERKAWFDFIIGQDDQVIKGIEEGLFLMNKKSKYRFVIPSYMAYKEKGTINGMVKPYSPVVYDVELIDKR